MNATVLRYWTCSVKPLYRYEVRPTGGDSPAVCALPMCLVIDDLMADQRMDISSTMNEFMSPGSTDLISSSINPPGIDYTRKRKGSSTDYQ